MRPSNRPRHTFHFPFWVCLLLCSSLRSSQVRMRSARQAVQLVFSRGFAAQAEKGAERFAARAGEVGKHADP